MSKLALRYLATSIIFLTTLAFIAIGCNPTNDSATNDSATGDPEPENQSNQKDENGDGANSVADNSAAQDDHDKTEGESSTNDDGNGSNKEPDQRETAKFPEEVMYDGWPDPEFALFISGRQHGYLEPCGCTGLENQRGGLMRRHTMQQELIGERGWKLVSLDAGNQVRRIGRQPEIKFHVTIDSLKKVMKYDAIGLGPDDLRISVDELATQTISLGPDEQSPIVCANVFVYGRETARQFHIASVGEKKIGITSVLGKEHVKKIDNESIEVIDPVEGLKEVFPKLEGESCDLTVLMCQASIEETKELAKQFPNFDVVVTAGGEGEPTLEPEKIEGTDAIMIQVGTKGMFVGVIGVFDDDTTPLRYQRVALTSEFDDSGEMLELFKAYQDQLKELGLAGLGLRPIPHVSGREFVGSKACQDCHSDEYKIWKEGHDEQGGPHAHGTESLIHPYAETTSSRSAIPRHFDPECLSCHTTGWNPQSYYPYKSGYLKVEDSLLHGNGCENCHGPGSAHVAAENGDVEATDEELEKLQKEMRLTLEEAKSNKCFVCHDLDNSPDFHEKGAFEEYWAKIKH